MKQQAEEKDKNDWDTAVPLKLLVDLVCAMSPTCKGHIVLESVVPYRGVV